MKINEKKDNFLYDNFYIYIFGGIKMWFFSLFGSKHKKLVKKWQDEHGRIVVLAHKVIGAYSKNDHKEAKKLLRELNSLAVDHIMDEDLEFYNTLKEHKMDAKTETQIKEFVATFKGTKMALMNFLTAYTKEDAVLDEKFFHTFNEIVEVLGKRIAFEEENLYSDLKVK